MHTCQRSNKTIKEDFKSFGTEMIKSDRALNICREL